MQAAILQHYSTITNMVSATSKWVTVMSCGKTTRLIKLWKCMKMSFVSCVNFTTQDDYICSMAIMISKKKYLDPIFPDMKYYESVILRSEHPAVSLHVTHGHQADFFNSALWRLSRFLVRHLWTPLENFGFLDPTSAAKNNTKRDKIEQKFINYSKCSYCRFLAGHTHRPKLGDEHTPYYNCGSCVHPRCITCIELCGYQMYLVKWSACTEKSEHFGNIYAQCPPTFPVYIKREVLAEETLA